MNFLLTCSAWLEKIAKNEVLKQGWNITEVKDRLVFFEGPEELISKINLWSRVWNKLYLILWSKKNVDNFDILFDLVYSIDWQKYINKNHPIITKATTIKSTLTSTPVLQSITKKAIVKKLNNWSDKFLLEDIDLPNYEVFSFLIEDETFVLLNTSWDTLYKRGYRYDAWEAPIKESLAAWLVILSNWKFSDTLYDPFCWSWTIVIEALMLAKNIAPGINRKFAFENWSFLDKNILLEEKEIAKSKIFNKDYKVIASDISPEMIEISKENAKNAWVLDDIDFRVLDFREYKKENLSWTLITNPPYWLRLKDDDLKGLYKDVISLFDKNESLNWWFISSYNDFNHRIFKNRKLYNWNEMCYFYLKK